MRQGYAIILTAALLLGGAGMNLTARGLQEVKETEEITIEAASLKGPYGFGMIKMFEDVPELGPEVDSNFSVLPSPKAMVSRVAGGELDFAVFPANMAAKMYTAGPGYKLGAVVGMGVLHLLSRDPEISEWKDLQNKTVYSIGKGATPDYLFQYLLSQHGLYPKENVQLDFSVSSGPQLAQLLISGKIDTAILPEPFVTMVRTRASDVRRVLDFQSSWQQIQGGETTYPITVVVVKPQIAAERPELVERFLEAYSESIEWVNSNPAEAAQLIGKYEVMPAALAEPAIPHCNLKFIPSAAARPIMEEFLQVLLDFNPASVGGQLPDDGFYLSQ
ncbi:MAG: ABC transporter substrate-binding protein [Spirochaetia bacterium]|nr:ABC transporter substrate-binding protein [Spirochaetia bacterium]